MVHTSKRQTWKVKKNSLQLAVGLELRLDGYNVTFDKVIRGVHERVCVDIFAEDEFEARIAVCCAEKTNVLNQRLKSLLNVIVESHGADCEVAVAIPVTMMDLVDELLKYVFKVYMVDFCGRVWLYDGGKGGVHPAIKIVEPQKRLCNCKQVSETKPCGTNCLRPFYIV
jgi:hypothetical protein